MTGVDVQCTYKIEQVKSRATARPTFSQDYISTAYIINLSDDESDAFA